MSFLVQRPHLAASIDLRLIHEWILGSLDAILGRFRCHWSHTNMAERDASAAFEGAKVNAVGASVHNRLDGKCSGQSRLRQPLSQHL